MKLTNHGVVAAACGAACALAAAAFAANPVSVPPSAGGWKPKDMNRPRPPVRDPGPPTAKEFAPPPPGAIVLFDGRDLSA